MLFFLALNYPGVFETLDLSFCLQHCVLAAVSLAPFPPSGSVWIGSVKRDHVCVATANRAFLGRRRESQTSVAIVVAARHGVPR